MTAITDALPDDPGTLKAMLIAERARAERLQQIIKELQRHRFSRRAEKLPEDQLLLGWRTSSRQSRAPRKTLTKRTRRPARGGLPSAG